MLLIADEVMSGFGRCGEWFAWQRYGEQGRPDLMTLAKGLTGSACCRSARWWCRRASRALESQPLATGLTYCGHPLCCAVGIAAIETYESERLIERSRRLGAVLLERLQRLQAQHRVVGEVRGGHGLFAVIELVRDRNTRAPLAPWDQRSPLLATLLSDALRAGVSFAARGNLIILAPPLVIGERELLEALELLDQLLFELEQRLSPGTASPNG